MDADMQPGCGYVKDAVYPNCVPLFKLSRRNKLKVGGAVILCNILNLIFLIVCFCFC